MADNSQQGLGGAGQPLGSIHPLQGENSPMFGQTARQGMTATNPLAASLARIAARRKSQAITSTLNNDAIAMDKTAGIPNVSPRMLAKMIPIGLRRDFDEDEQKEVDRGESQMFPKFIQEPGTPIPQLLASVPKQGLLGGLGGAAVGGAAGGALGGLAGHPGAGAAIGASTLGLYAALKYGFKRHEKNEHLIEGMHRLPKGATKQDYDTSHALQHAMADRYGMKLSGDMVPVEQGNNTADQYPQPDDMDTLSANPPKPNPTSSYIPLFKKEAQDMTPFARAFFARCLQHGMSEYSIKQAVDTVHAQFGPAVSDELYSNMEKVALNPGSLLRGLGTAARWGGSMLSKAKPMLGMGEKAVAAGAHMPGAGMAAEKAIGASMKPFAGAVGGAGRSAAQAAEEAVGANMSKFNPGRSLVPNGSTGDPFKYINNGARTARAAEVGAGAAGHIPPHVTAPGGVSSSVMSGLSPEMQAAGVGASNPNAWRSAGQATRTGLGHAWNYGARPLMGGIAGGFTGNAATDGSTSGTLGGAAIGAASQTPWGRAAMAANPALRRSIMNSFYGASGGEAVDQLGNAAGVDTGGAGARWGSRLGAASAFKPKMGQGIEDFTHGTWGAMPGFGGIKNIFRGGWKSMSPAGRAGLAVGASAPILGVAGAAINPRDMGTDGVTGGQGGGPGQVGTSGQLPSSALPGSNMATFEDPQHPGHFHSPGTYQGGGASPPAGANGQPGAASPSLLHDPIGWISHATGFDKKMQAQVQQASDKVITDLGFKSKEDAAAFVAKAKGLMNGGGGEGMLAKFGSMFDPIIDMIAGQGKAATMDPMMKIMLVMGGGALLGGAAGGMMGGGGGAMGGALAGMGGMALAGGLMGGFPGFGQHPPTQAAPSGKAPVQGPPAEGPFGTGPQPGQENVADRMSGLMNSPGAAAYRSAYQENDPTGDATAARNQRAMATR